MQIFTSIILVWPRFATMKREMSSQHANNKNTVSFGGTGRLTIILPTFVATYIVMLVWNEYEVMRSNLP